MKIFGIGAPELVIIGIPLLFGVLFGFLSNHFGTKKGYGPSICFAAGFFLSVIGFVIILLLPDKNPSKHGAASELQAFKKLMDDGAITQEEFEAKKKELL